MSYTLWSQGRLLGETELEGPRSSCLRRTGGFWPTVVGAKIVPIATAVFSATSMLAAKSRELDACATDASSDVPDLQIQQLTEYADYVAAVDRLRALELELRGPDGAIIPTESIEISDSEFLADLVRRELEIELDESIPDDAYDDGDEDFGLGPENAGEAMRDIEFDSGSDIERAIERMIEHDVTLIPSRRPLEELEEGDIPVSVREGNGEAYLPTPPFPLYQIHVYLVDANLIL